jgi:hypothetical protein
MAKRERNSLASAPARLQQSSLRDHSFDHQFKTLIPLGFGKVVPAKRPPSFGALVCELTYNFLDIAAQP